MAPEVVLLRFSVAFAGAFAFGLVRQWLRKPIGFGTFILLTLGSCALALTALTFNPENPLPLLGSIVTGIGFLGAGALIRAGERVVGFTSSATIWTFSVLGLAIGVGEYLVAGLVYGAIWAVTLTDFVLERHWLGAHRRRLYVEVPVGTSDESLSEIGLPKRAAAQALHIDRERGAMSLTYLVNRPTGDPAQLLERLSASELVQKATIESSLSERRVSSAVVRSSAAPTP